MHNLSLAASVMAMNQLSLGDDIRTIEAAGIDIFHWDIMDGHFVPNMTFGPATIQAARPLTQKPFDVHLMVSEPAAWIDVFAKAGSNSLTFHQEATNDITSLAAKIRSHGVKAGLAFNPDTQLDAVDDAVFAHIDRILIMTVNPGFGGQTFIDQSAKIRQAKEIQTRHTHLDIMVDGGINDTNAHLSIQAGANILVSGSALMKAAMPSQFISSIKEMSA